MFHRKLLHDRLLSQVLNREIAVWRAFSLLAVGTIVDDRKITGVAIWWNVLGRGAAIIMTSRRRRSGETVVQWTNTACGICVVFGLETFIDEGLVGFV